MAIYYDKKTKKEKWGDDGFQCLLEDVYSELEEHIARKRLDGHDEYDRWVMLVHNKMSELLDLLDYGYERKIAPDLLDDDIVELC